MNKTKWVIGHIAFWLFVTALVLFPMIRFRVFQPIPYVLTSFFIYLSSFYVNLFIVIPYWLRHRNIYYLILTWLGVLALYGIIFVPVNYAFDAHQKRGFWMLVLISVVRSTFFTGIFLFMSTVYKLAWDWFVNERIKQRLENQNLKTELAFLKSQINPHFLFNTLNNIYVLAYQQSNKTADAVMKLSDMMRYLLYESNDERISLDKEIHYIRQMIDLHQLRTREPLALEFTVDEDMSDYQIPPLLLIPFIENIFKHARINEPLHPVTITLKNIPGGLQFCSRNMINHSLKDSTGGIGLVNVRRRLELLYPGKHEFVAANDGEYFYVDLTLQLN